MKDRAPTFELDVLEERQRQDDKWGLQRHEKLYWLGILTEEIGEVAKAAIEDASSLELRNELIQVAAVCCAWVEQIDEIDVVEEILRKK